MFLSRYTLRALFGLILCAASLWAGREFPALPGEEVVPDELIVRLKPGADLASVLAASAPGSQIVSQTAYRTHLVRAPHGQAANASNALSKHASVEFVEPNGVLHHAGGLPALNDPNANQQWALNTVEAVAAWNILPDRFFTAATAGSGRIRVA